ncbi:MAG: hypothetical protein PARBA_00282 [Parabacteroides sp.]
MFIKEIDKDPEYYETQLYFMLVVLSNVLAVIVQTFFCYSGKPEILKLRCSFID